LMADISPDIIKIDMDVTRHLHERPTSAAIVRMMAQLCAELNITLIAEGIETVEEYDALRDCGITLMQGYLLAKPAFETLPGFTLPRSRVTATR
jgi:EAL domain-containing protein (putative c-di-GMP-specific phosphodiesterase class I)